MEKPVVVITGASQGLGAELARLFALKAEGLIVTARRAEPLQTLQRELNALTTAIAIPGSVDDDDHAHEVIRTAHERFGRIDILVNNASTLGGSPMPPLEKLSPTAFAKLMNVNVRAPLHLAQHALPNMRERGTGTIVNISSDAAVKAYAGWGGYGASKAALEHLSRILAEELQDSGIRVLVIDPGNMNTQMHRDAEPGVDLSDLPHPRAVAPQIIDFIETAQMPYARYEVRALAGSV